MYLHGLGVKINKEKAELLFQSSSSEGCDKSREILRRINQTNSSNLKIKDKNISTYIQDPKLQIISVAEILGTANSIKLRADEIHFKLFNAIDFEEIGCENPAEHINEINLNAKQDGDVLISYCTVSEILNLTDQISMDELDRLEISPKPVYFSQTMKFLKIL